MGARHLLNLGHQRIAYVRTVGQTGFFYSAAQREQGFRAELEAAGLPERGQIILSAPSTTDGEQVVAQHLSQPLLPTALMVESDELALSVMAACWRMGLRTPEDVSVLGFDDHAMAGTFGLSTIAQPVGLLGRQAAAMAMGLVTAAVRSEEGDRGGGPEDPGAGPSVVTVPTRLVLRDSTARPPVRDVTGAVAAS